MQNWIWIISDFFHRMKKKNISTFSAGSAFFLFLSAGPMVAFLCACVPYVSLTKEELTALIVQFIPDKFHDAMNYVVSEIFESSPGVMSVAAILMIWAAGKGTLALMRGLNVIYEVEERRNYFAVRVVASFYTVIMILTAFLLLGLIVLSNAFLIRPFRYILAWIVLTILFAVVYSFLPDISLKIQQQFPGAMLSATAWIGFSWGFSIYMNIADLSVIYGSLSVLALIMLWLYFGMYILLSGAYFNRYFRKHLKKDEPDL